MQWSSAAAVSFGNDSLLEVTGPAVRHVYTMCSRHDGLVCGLVVSFRQSFLVV